jgi:O-antigen/teichoic acid export membrane protein
MIFFAFTEITQKWLIRKKQFLITSRIAVLNALMINCLKTGFGLFKPMAAVLVLFQFLAMPSMQGSWPGGLKHLAKIIRIRPKISEKKVSILELAKKYYDFPLYRAPQTFINAISQSLPILMMAVFFDLASAGFYTLCRRLLGIPAMLIGQSFSDVFYPRLTEAAHRGENLYFFIIKTTLSLALIASGPFGIIIIFGPSLFGFVFGQEWIKAGEYARYLSFWVFFMFINRPSIIAISILNLQKGLLVYEVFSTGAKFFGLYIGFVVFKNDVIAIALLSFFGTISSIFLIVWVVLSSVHYERKKQTCLKIK